VELLFALLCRAFERAAHRCERCFGPRCEQLAQRRRSREIAGPQFWTEPGLAEQRLGKVGQRVSARGENCGPPCIDFGNDAGCGHVRHDACAQQRGLARAACADKEQKGGIAQLCRCARKGGFAAEEYRSVNCFECGQAAKR
jgi:hypothetical protein